MVRVVETMCLSQWEVLLLFVPDLGHSRHTMYRHLPEAQVPPQLGGARADAWQLLEQAPGRAAHRALIGFALPRLLP